jgi:ABC-type sugar transport system ATPase subunit
MTADTLPLALRVEQVAKAFGPTQALRSCSFDLRAGEVHALLGENGSGKSTLVKILNGVHRADSGSIEIGGVALSGTAASRASGQAGVVATVFQEVLVVPGQSVLENIWLGADGLLREKVPSGAKRRRAKEILEALLGSVPDLDLPVGPLPLSVRQVCVIARALVRDPEVLILDEATSALDVDTRDRLFEVVRRLGARGVATIFISHRMDEIQELPDRITVLRAGRTVATVSRGEVPPDELVRLMVGADRVAAGLTIESVHDGDPELVLSGRQIRLSPGSPPFDVSIHAGERIGVAGLDGNGQEKFLRILACLDQPAEGTVSRHHNTGRTRLRSFAEAAKHGVVYVPRDRRSESIFDALSIRDNFAVLTDNADVSRGLISYRRMKKRLSAFIDSMGIKLGDSANLITTLSGGNQQKIIMARWLATEPKVLLLNDPTRGIDHRAKRDIYTLLGALATNRVAVVMLSSEVDELVELMDRVFVFWENSLVETIPRANLTRANLVSSFFGEPASE